MFAIGRGGHERPRAGGFVRKLAIAIAVAACASLAACGGDDPPRRYTCDASADADLRSCTQFGPLDEYGVEYNEGYCLQSGGTWGRNLPCPTEGRVASCDMPRSRGSTEQHFYAGFTDLAGVGAQCTAYGGSWTTY